MREFTRGSWRRDVVDESVVGAYHVFGRSARQDFLLGLDPISGRDDSHRKLILRNRPELVSGWSDAEVAERWLLLNRADLRLRASPTAERIAGLVSDAKEMAKIRRRMSSIRWFMGYLREPLARVFNAEDGKSGHFWERFGCVDLKNETSLLACSLYVAMNPVRAGMAVRRGKRRCV